MTDAAAPPPAPGPQAANAPPSAAPLDDVMLAMDVVDTLRQRQDLVARELAEPQRAQELIGRLRKIYAAQGIDVPDAVLEQGVAALAEERFVHRPPPPSFATTMARIYVTRRRWGTLLLAAIAIVVVAIASYRSQVVAPRAALPAELTAAYTSTLEVAAEPTATERADALVAVGRGALRDGDVAAVRGALSDLEQLRATLEQSYQVRIVNRPGEASGVWRVPDINPDARNYYLIVEALGPDGRPLTVRVHDEETGADVAVRSWGLRVDEATYRAVERDKLDDGILQNDLVGRKQRGNLEPTYTVATTGAAITRW